MFEQVVTLWYRAPEILLGDQLYSTPVDVWSIGCIFAEMVTSKPLFPGDSEIDELFRIFRTLGTPDENVWPGVSELPEYKADFPRFAPQSLAQAVPRLDAQGLDLLTVSILLLYTVIFSANNMIDCFVMFLLILFFINFFSGKNKTKQKMLLYNPKARISAKMALQHPYFNGLDPSTI